MTTTTDKRGPGRPKGLAKSGGRKKGVPNKVTKDVRETILKRGKPIEFLADVVAGKKIRVGPQAGPGEPEFHYPSFRERYEAAAALLPFVAPKMASIDQTIDQTVRDGDFDADAVKAALLDSLRDELKHESARPIEVDQDRDDGRAGEAGGVSSSAPPELSEPEDGAAVSSENELPQHFANGAVIASCTISGSGTEKIGIFDRHGILHGYRRGLAEAKTFAETLPGPWKGESNEVEMAQ